MNAQTHSLPHAPQSRRGLNIFGRLMALDSAYRQRVALKSLDAHLLRDIGLGD